MLRSLATQIAIAIQQGRLYQQLLELNANLEQLVEQRTAQLMAQNQELYDRQIITAHGGEIGVTSSPGAGTTFWFTLPPIGNG